MSNRELIGRLKQQRDAAISAADRGNSLLDPLIDDLSAVIKALSAMEGEAEPIITGGYDEVFNIPLRPSPASERAEVVAFIRNRKAPDTEYRIATALDALATRIERGEHLRAARSLLDKPEGRG